MIFTVHGQSFPMDDPGKVSSLIEEVVGTSYPEDEIGERTWLGFAEKNDADIFSRLCVSANAATGYGALIWCAIPGRGIEDREICKTLWISDNPQPPEADPYLVADPGYVSFHDRASAIPLAQVRSAVQEYISAGTGQRPKCVTWVAGEITGRRADRPPLS
ncbi:Imm1 family immunity protein [Kitasatospora sp. NPDC004240]